MQTIRISKIQQILSLCLFIMVLQGCSDHFDMPEPEVKYSKMLSDNRIPNTYQRVCGVGWGYDCNTYYGDPKGVKEQIFSAQKIKALSESSKYDGTLFIEDEPFGYAKSFTCTGENSSDYSEKLSVQASIGVSIPFAFALDVNARFSQSDMQSGSYYFSTRRYKYVYKRRIMDYTNLQAIADMGEDIYTDAFRSSLQQLINNHGGIADIRNFVNTFGNTFVCSSEIGGRLDYNMTVKKDGSISENEVEIGVEANLLSLFSMSLSETQKNVVSKLNENSKTSVSAKGGDVTILGKALLNGQPCDSIALVNWTKSIDDSNSQMVDCVLQPIWLLIPDEEVAAKVKRYITGKEDDYGYSFPQPEYSHVCFSVPEFDEAKTLVKTAWLHGRPMVEFCRELESKYHVYNRVTMAYPIIDNVPDYSKGICVDDSKQFYMDGDVLALQPRDQIQYAQADAAVDVKLEHEGVAYPLVKVGSKVWTRRSLSSTKSYQGESLPDKANDNTYNYKLGDNTLYNNFAGIPFHDYIPDNWRLPLEDDVTEMNKLFNVSDAYLAGGSTGLDIHIESVCQTNGESNMNEIESAYLISGTPNQLIRFQRLDAVGLVDTRYLAQLRLIRSSSFRYK